MWNAIKDIFIIGACKALYDTFFGAVVETRPENCSQGEWECHRVVKELLPRYTFIKVRPNFLKNPETKHNLELDLYCEQLNLAIEYNGSQHYEYSHRFHRSEQDLIQQQKRDKLKVKLCRQHGVKLIVVSYKVTNIREYVRLKLRKLNYI